MGRVTRMIKAAADQRTESPPSHNNSPGMDRDLPRVIAAWPHMPDHFKKTVMSLVELVESKRAH